MDMKSNLIALAAIAASVAFGTAASAQTVGIGTTKGGATNQVATSIAKVVTLNSDLQMRTQTMGGTQQYIPIVNAGEMDFGISNLPQYWMATTGTGMSEGTKYENLRLVATLMQFRVGPTVAAKSEIRKTSDLKDKRVPFGFRSAPLFAFVMNGFLANGGLTYEDVSKVPAIGLPQHWTMFKEGKLDVVISAVGTGAVKEMNAVTDGGVRYISLDTSDAAIKRLLDIYPRSYIAEVKPGKGLVGVLEPVQILHYDYMLWAHKGTDDEAVYKVAKAVYESEKELKASSPLWRSFSPSKMAKDQGTGYHPAALRFYKEAGLAK